MNEERDDGLLFALTKEKSGIEDLLDSVFGFLYRKTDFYRNASTSDAYSIVLKSFNKYNELEKKKISSQKFVEIKNSDSEKKNILEKKLKDEEDQKPNETVEEGTVHPTKGNGSKTDKYSWAQTLDEVEARVIFKDSKSLKGNNMNVVIEKNSIKVGRKGETPLVEGVLYDSIKVENTFWTIEDNEIVIIIAKMSTMSWWSYLLKGEIPIDTKKIKPENSKLSDLDGETRTMVEKMMYDQKQKELGLPSSDDLNKQEMLSKFMKEHPEMDFSKAKFQ